MNDLLDHENLRFFDGSSSTDGSGSDHDDLDGVSLHISSVLSSLITQHP